MLTWSVALFVLAALSGLYLSTMHFQGKSLTLPPALAHGLFAAAGLVLLVVVALQSGVEGFILYALILFVIAALGGFMLFSFHLRDKSLPSAMVVIHALGAVTAFALLLAGMYL